MMTQITELQYVKPDSYLIPLPAKLVKLLMCMIIDEVIIPRLQNH